MSKQIIFLFAILFSKNVFSAISTNIKKEITVAIIDTGTDINHKELKENIWVNPGETGLDRNGNPKETNGIDDDGNGYADDLHGWNFVLNNNDVSDSQGHGTHIAGIIKNEFSKNNSEQNVKLMILKYYDEKSSDSENINNTVKAIQYATAMNARVINYSAGGANPFSKEKWALEKASEKNIVVVAAAGNNKENSDNKKYYPANYPLENIISVAAVKDDGELSEFSNYGKNSVDIAAPGDHILSTLPRNRYGIMSGTSQATAYVTGSVAKLLLENPTLKNGSVILKKLLDHSQYSDKLKNKTRYAMAMLQ